MDLQLINEAWLIHRRLDSQDTGMKGLKWLVAELFAAHDQVIREFRGHQRAIQPRETIRTGPLLQSQYLW